MKDNLLTLISEERNPASMTLSQMSTAEIIALMNREDTICAASVADKLESIEAAIELCIDKLSGGGRVIFIGAAHSGYLGLLDAYEANATFGCAGEFVSIVAGNPADITETDGSAEDSQSAAQQDLEARKMSKKDVVFAISASGRTPYVLGALRYAQACGVKTIALSNNKNTLVSQFCDIDIEITPGPEVITGSTRLKAGTCTKMVLNMVTTASMVRLGKTYSNLMIFVPPVSDKMRKRLRFILCQATGCCEERAVDLLTQTGYDMKTALIMELKKVPPEQARQELEAHGGNVNLAAIL